MNSSTKPASTPSDSPVAALVTMGVKSPACPPTGGAQEGRFMGPYRVTDVSPGGNRSLAAVGKPAEQERFSRTNISSQNFFASANQPLCADAENESSSSSVFVPDFSVPPSSSRPGINPNAMFTSGNQTVPEGAATEPSSGATSPLPGVISDRIAALNAAAEAFRKLAAKTVPVRPGFNAEAMFASATPDVPNGAAALTTPTEPGSSSRTSPDPGRMFASATNDDSSSASSASGHAIA